MGTLDKYKITVTDKIYESFDKLTKENDDKFSSF